MKTQFLLNGISAVIFLLYGCTQVVDVQNDYFGQRPPGRVPELFAPGIISTGAHDMSITISSDLKEIYVGRSSLNWVSNVACYRNKSGEWVGPELAPFTGGRDANYPYISCDNKTVYFNSTRPVRGNEPGSVSYKIWVSFRSGEKWTSAELLDDQLDPSAHVTFPCVSKSGNIYFNSTLEGGFGKSDIYRMKKTDNGYSKPKNMSSAINSEHLEFHPFISPDEDYLIFDSVRPEGFGRNDLYISFRKPDGGWTHAVNMGESVNTGHMDMRPSVSPDGKYLFFCSSRNNPQAELDPQNPTYEDFSRIINGPGNGSQDIYWIDASIIGELKTSELR